MTLEEVGYYQARTKRMLASPQMVESPRPAAASAPDSPTVSVGDVVRGRMPGTSYRIEEELGAGGMGAVYRVTQKSSGQTFALKVLHAGHANSDALRRRFEREAQALAALDHPNVVAIIDYGTENDEPYLVMELLEGETLSERLRRQPLDARELRKYAGELLSAMVYVHRQGLVHRDLKPGNVFLHRQPDGSEQTKVLDFGFVKFVEPRGQKVDPLTRTGEMFGTPAYMAPEQIGCEATDARTDVYALGVLLFEMATGRKPFEGDFTDVLRGHLVEAPPSLATACPGLEACVGLEPLIERALRKPPRDRFADAGEMLAAFEALPDPLLRPRTSESPGAALGLATTVVQPQASDSAKPALRRSSRWAPAAAWASALWHRVLTAGAIALIVVSLAVILVSGIAIYGLRAGKPTGEGSDPADVADSLEDELQATKRRILAIGAGIGRELQRRLPAASEPLAPGATAGAERAPARDPWRRPIPSSLRKILDMSKAGGRGSERAFKALRAYNREHPGDARGHLLLARLYWNRGWRADALAQYELAARIDPTARGATGMLEHLVGSLGRPATAERAASLIAALYGGEALDAVDRALHSPPENAEHRGRLLALRARLSRAPAALRRRWPAHRSRRRVGRRRCSGCGSSSPTWQDGVGGRSSLIRVCPVHARKDGLRPCSPSGTAARPPAARRGAQRPPRRRG